MLHSHTAQWCSVAWPSCEAAAGGKLQFLSTGKVVARSSGMGAVIQGTEGISGCALLPPTHTAGRGPSTALPTLKTIKCLALEKSGDCSVLSPHRARDLFEGSPSSQLQTLTQLQVCGKEQEKRFLMVTTWLASVVSQKTCGWCLCSRG